MDELKIEVYGRVQGVRFRKFTKALADRLSVKGRVYNVADGSVSIVAQASKKVLDAFLTNLQQGSTFSKIDGLSYRWKRAETEYDGFYIVLDKDVVADQKSSFINLGKRLLGLSEVVPRHVAIIPDGNRRWAQEQGLVASKGHEKASSFENLTQLIEEAERLGVKYITFWAFSTENWKRSKVEVEYLFNLLKKSMQDLHAFAIKHQIRFRYLGRKDRIPDYLIKELERLERDTKVFSKLNLQICLDYGGRDELVRAINHILKSGVKKISEDEFEGYLDSAGIPDPDLIVRTSGEQRTSGFMPYQSTYAELYFSPAYFPDFGPAELQEAVAEFGRRKRRFGK